MLIYHGRLHLLVVPLQVPILHLLLHEASLEGLHVLTRVQVLELDGVDDLVQEEGRVGDVARYPVQLLLLPQVETLAHKFLADDTGLVL